MDVAGALARLVKVAPESTVFAVTRGDAVFMGATPERLVRTEGRDARTVAIAGTAGRGADPAEDDALAAELLASEKEREEHAVVVRMLRDSLAPLCETLEIAREPRVIRLRTVQHLCTDVTARTSDRAGILSLVGVLHPTPAVGGQPRAAALDLIREQERIDRGWYAAPFGWVDRDGDGEFVVALRSGVVRGATREPLRRLRDRRRLGPRPRVGGVADQAPRARRRARPGGAVTGEPPGRALRVPPPAPARPRRRSAHSSTAWSAAASAMPSSAPARGPRPSRSRSRPTRASASSRTWTSARDRSSRSASRRPRAARSRSR